MLRGKKKEETLKTATSRKKGCGSFFFLYCVPSMTLLCRFNRNTQHKLTDTWWKMPTHKQRRQRNKFLVLRIKKCFACVCVRVCWGCVTAVLMKKRTKKVFVKQIRTEKEKGDEMAQLAKKRKALADTVTRVCLYENACQHRIPKKKASAIYYWLSLQNELSSGRTLFSANPAKKSWKQTSSHCSIASRKGTTEKSDKENSREIEGETRNKDKVKNRKK